MWLAACKPVGFLVPRVMEALRSAIIIQNISSFLILIGLAAHFKYVLNKYAHCKCLRNSDRLHLLGAQAAAVAEALEAGPEAVLAMKWQDHLVCNWDLHAQHVAPLFVLCSLL